MFQNGHGTTIPSQSHVMEPTIKKKSYSFQVFSLICRRCNLFCQWARFRLEELTIWMGLAWPVQNPWLGEPWPGPLRHVWPMVNIIVLLVFNGFHHCYVILKIKERIHDTSATISIQIQSNCPLWWKETPLTWIIPTEPYCMLSKEFLSFLM